MRTVLPLCALFTVSVLAFLAHAAIDQKFKAIEIVHMPRIMFAGSDLGFQVRVRGAIDEDRQQWALLCNREDPDPCSLDHNERLSMVTIEGSAAPRLWSPKPWTHMPPGEFAVVVALGANDQIRVSDALTLTVQGM
jgi:hypothetical protein